MSEHKENIDFEKTKISACVLSYVIIVLPYRVLYIIYYHHNLINRSVLVNVVTREYSETGDTLIGQTQ